MRISWALPTVKTIVVSIITVAVTVIMMVAGTPALALADESAQDTINQLRQQGYTVKIDRVGTAPLSQCVVTDVRQPRTQTQLVPFNDSNSRLGRGPGGTRFLVPMNTSRTILVSLNCAPK